MTYPVSATPTVFVEHSALDALARRVSQQGVRALLVGWGEYAKHLINLHPNNIVAVCDENPAVIGMKFRNVPVISLNDHVDVNLIVICEYKYCYEFLGDVVKRYKNAPYFIPDSLHYKKTSEINPFAQERVYRALFEHAAQAPISMMSDEKVRFLLEILRLGLTFDGDIVEMGSWQGGSGWHMGKLLSLLGEKRKLFLMDLFETHVMDPTATMCFDEIQRRMDSAYAHNELLVGLVDDPKCLARIPGKICFAHIDLGPIPRAMEFVWERLSPGAPLLLDNYGHVRAPTWEFDDFFKARGARVTRLPWSEQGLVFKRP